MIALLAVAASMADFDAAVPRARQEIAAARAARAQAAPDDLRDRIANLNFDLRNRRQDAEQLRWDLTNLRPRLLRYQPSRPGDDPALRYDVARLSQAAKTLSREVALRSSDLRWISAQAEKDPSLVQPAQTLSQDTLDFKQSAGFLRFDSEGVLGDLRRAGFDPDAADIDDATQRVQDDAQTIQNDSQTLLMKVRG